MRPPVGGNPRGAPGPGRSASLVAAMGRTPGPSALHRHAPEVMSIRNTRPENRTAPGAPRAVAAAWRGGRLALAGIVALTCSASAGTAAAATNINGWGAISADMAGGTLVWADAQPARTRTFTYWRTDAGRARVSGTRISGVTKPVTVRTSAGALTGTQIRATGVSRGFTLTASGASFAGPVTWCCTSEDQEVVVSSNGAGDAPHPYASGLDGTRVRWIAGSREGAVLGSADPVEYQERQTSAAIPGNPGPGLASVATGIAAWADRGGSLIRFGVPADDGVGNLREARQGGRVLEVRAAPRFIAAVVRRGGYRVTRTDVATGRVRIVWRGSKRPRIATGGRAIAIGAGRTVLTSRGGSARKVADARGPIAAVATNGTRVAVFERITRRVTKGKRTTSVRSTAVRIAGRVR
jgi:hypothetical protein